MKTINLELLNKKRVVIFVDHITEIHYDNDNYVVVSLDTGKEYTVTQSMDEIIALISKLYIEKRRQL